MFQFGSSFNTLSPPECSLLIFMATNIIMASIALFSDLYSFQVESTDERIDMEQLKVKEKIYFYEDVILFEDELADNGISKLNVKMVKTKCLV